MCRTFPHHLPDEKPLDALQRILALAKNVEANGYDLDNTCYVVSGRWFLDMEKVLKDAGLVEC